MYVCVHMCTMNVLCAVLSKLALGTIISQKSHKEVFFLLESKTSQKLRRSQITEEGGTRGGHCR